MNCRPAPAQTAFPANRGQLCYHYKVRNKLWDEFVCIMDNISIWFDWNIILYIVI